MIEYGLAVIYGVVAFTCAAATLVEGRGDRTGWDAMRLAGVGLCFIWPLVLLLLLALSLMGQPGRRGVRRIVQGGAERRPPGQE